MKNRQARKKEFTITVGTRDARGKPTTAQVTVRAARYRSAVRIARGVVRGEMTLTGKTIPRTEREA